jgi:hypothetical protein
MKYDNDNVSDINIVKQKLGVSLYGGLLKSDYLAMANRIVPGTPSSNSSETFLKSRQQ